MIASFSLILLYYGGSEALWARTAGKALLGLTLVDGAGRPPRPAVAFARALLFAGPNILLGLGVLTIWGGGFAAQTPERRPDQRVHDRSASWLILVTLFAAARRRNGYAALHDLATGMRVVERRGARPGANGRRRPRHRSSPPRPSSGIADRSPCSTARSRAGPSGGRASTSGCGARCGSATCRSARRRSPRRGSRCRGRRACGGSPAAGRREEAWDVYEGVAGVPIAQACRSPRSWSEVRRWLADLAHELAAQQPGDHPPLDLDRVWILDSGRAKLLDDPTADAPTADGPSWPAHVRRRSPARGRASGARRQPPAVAGRGIAFRHPVVGGAAGRDVRSHAGRGRAAARPGRGDARLAHPVARGPHRVAHADGRHGRKHHGDALPAGAQRPRRDPGGDARAARAGSAQRPEGSRAGRS